MCAVTACQTLGHHTATRAARTVQSSDGPVPALTPTKGPTVARNRASAKAAGARFERVIADWLAEHVDDHIDKRPKRGAKDRGDIGGWRFAGRRIVAELKDAATMNLGGWVRQAEVERLNDDAHVGLVIHKRRGHGDPGDQYVTLTLRDLVALTTGERP